MNICAEDLKPYRKIIFASVSVQEKSLCMIKVLKISVPIISAILLQNFLNEANENAEFDGVAGKFQMA